jgi:hypothetical protein
VHYVGHYTISFQNARSLQHKKPVMFLKPIFFFNEGKQADKESKDELPEEMLVNRDRPQTESPSLQNTQSAPT